MTDMYPWVTAPNVNALAGKCSHECIYCYVDEMKRFPASAAKYSGLPRIHMAAMKAKSKPGVAFLCSCNDLFADDVPEETIMEIIDWAARQDQTTWVIQTKNPRHPLFRHLISQKPENFLLGTTIESNRDYPEISKAPSQNSRFIMGLDFITIEPIMAFDVTHFASQLILASPKFINIGADSGNNHLPEPCAAKVYELVAILRNAGIEVRLKSNLKRIAPGATA